ncbi:thiamine phosphate synthase [Chitinophaga tropicalis]|uniref:Thiamine phosphate synthase/TenI domain-containing protein n=1 Tax=Chitinophaga tropicalis TaxID=2683588 RepID=A0A7K1TY30_9BACT|nr:thiamine phosphate synthase [Chitinophaga tropicalis]MVT07024.1 hypothetical protein [Chitinophaga tropicalis]
MIRIITYPGHFPGETALWLQLLNAGADSILLRKPGWQEADYEALLQQADPACYNRLIIAGLPSLCERYNLRGLHFSETARSMLSAEQLHSYQSNGWILSTSIHSIQTLKIISDDWSQLFLSPVFNSISKQAYPGIFSKDFRLDKNSYKGQVLALGGVDQHTAAIAHTMQFDGIALLGAIWLQPGKAIENFCQIKDVWKQSIHQADHMY